MEISWVIYLCIVVICTKCTLGKIGFPAMFDDNTKMMNGVDSSALSRQQDCQKDCLQKVSTK